MHSAALLNPPSGIANQMLWEQQAAQQLGLDWSVKLFCPKNSTSSNNITQFDNDIDFNDIKGNVKKIIAWRLLRHNYHSWLLSQQDGIDIFLLRYYVHDPYQLYFINKCRKPVFFVHHTMEIPELSMPSHNYSLVRSSLEAAIGIKTLRKAFGIIGVTEEIIEYEVKRAKIYNKPTFIYPNGIVLSTEKLEDKRDLSTPELLFVANFAPWHGLDLLLESLRMSDEKLILHLVGKIPSNVMHLVNDTRIVVHGEIKQNEISELSKKCWVGLSSFGLHRKKMTQACPLKVREYLMLGLPVYGDYKDIFPEKAFFFKYGNESISDIIKFCRQSRILNKNHVRSESKPFICKVNLLDKLNIFLREATSSEYRARL